MWREDVRKWYVEAYTVQALIVIAFIITVVLCRTKCREGHLWHFSGRNYGSMLHLPFEKKVVKYWALGIEAIVRSWERHQVCTRSVDKKIQLAMNESGLETTKAKDLRGLCQCLFAVFRNAGDVFLVRNPTTQKLLDEGILCTKMELEVKYNPSSGEFEVGSHLIISD